jgi:hypothetical protein
VDVVSGHRLAQGAQQRDGARHARLEVEVGAVHLGGPVDGRAVLGQQRLVGGDHRLAVRHGGQNEGPRRLDAADHFDDDVHVVAGDQGLGVGREQGGVDVGVALAAQPAHRHARQLHRRADPGGQVVGLLAQQPHDLRPHHSAAQQRDLEHRFGLVHEPSSLRLTAAL